MSFNYSVKVYKLPNPAGKMVAMASVLIDEFLEVKGFKIFDGSKGLFVKPPSHKGTDKEGAEKYYDDVFFVEEKAEGEFSGPRQKEMFDQILTEYSGQQGGTKPRENAAKRQAETNEKTTGGSGMNRKPMW